MIKLEDREWEEFVVKDISEVVNSKAYHKDNLIESPEGLAYITRTNLNNGLETTVKKDTYKINPRDTVAFGAENATFFYQPYRYITGNKMYFIKSEKINKFTGLFLQQMLNKSVSDAGFGYGKGLTGTRMNTRKILLPIDENNNPDWQFMEDYIKERYQLLINQYKEYLGILDITGGAPTTLDEKEWGEFRILDYFDVNKLKGSEKNMDALPIGKTPLISAKKVDNGLKGFVKVDEKKIKPRNVISWNKDGDGGAGLAYYQPIKFAVDSHVMVLYPKESLSKETQIFITTTLSQYYEIFGHGRANSLGRLEKEKIVLPRNMDKIPDWDYMENYSKWQMKQQLEKYLEYVEQAF